VKFFTENYKYIYTIKMTDRDTQRFNGEVERSNYSPGEDFDSKPGHESNIDDSEDIFFATLNNCSREEYDLPHLEKFLNRKYGISFNGGTSFWTHFVNGVRAILEVLILTVPLILDVALHVRPHK